MSTDNRRLPLRIAALALCLSGGAAGLGLGAADAGTRIRHVLGPPALSAAEVYGGAPDGRSFDHARFDALLRAHVDSAGLVDYAGLSRERQALDAYLASLASAPFEELGRDEKLALLINAYNAFTLRLILDPRSPSVLRHHEGAFTSPRRCSVAGGAAAEDALAIVRARSAIR